MPDPLPYLRPIVADQPPLLYPAYRSSVARAPQKPPVSMPHMLGEITGPLFGHDRLRSNDGDLTRQHAGEPIGDRIIVTGRVLDENARPVARALVEIWQANSAGRYFHPRDSRNAPMDPNFTGGGRALADDEGWYRFVTVRPGYYPWGNHENAWRPAHIHFSLLGPSFVTRLVTQMYFPADPMLPYDPIYQQVPEGARERLVSRFDYGLTEHAVGLAYRFDIVLRGRQQTPMEDGHDYEH